MNLVVFDCSELLLISPWLQLQRTVGFAQIGIGLAVGAVGEVCCVPLLSLALTAVRGSGGLPCSGRREQRVANRSLSIKCAGNKQEELCMWLAWEISHETDRVDSGVVPIQASVLLLL